MAVADRSIDPKILENARKEFLAYGFEKASLKSICEQAGVTTGALYKRYAGKDDLFCAVVRQTVEDLQNIVTEKTAVDKKELTDQQLYDQWEMDETYLNWWFDYLYQRYDDFVLLLKYSNGSSHENFAHKWVEQMNQSTYSFYEEAYRRGIAKQYVTREEMHALITSFWSTIYEPFIHGMDWKKIKEHSRLVCRFVNWHEALQFEMPEETEIPTRESGHRQR